MNTTNEEKVAAMRSRMAELTGKFIERTEAEIQSMRASLARAGEGDAGALGEILHLAHRARGTSATLGLEALSTRAHAIEMLAEGPAGAPLDPATFSELKGAIEALAEELGHTPHS
jgi:HPt (histidine-containing phosphotransfer) domain-containing protein